MISALLVGMGIGSSFGVIGMFGQDYYYNNHDFYKIETILVNGTDIRPCSKVEITFLRDSEVNDPQAVFTRELTFVQVLDGADIYYEVRTTTTTNAIDKGRQTISGYVELPCNAQPGVYFFKYTVGYSVNGYKRSTSARSTQFEVGAANQVGPVDPFPDLVDQEV